MWRANKIDLWETYLAARSANGEAFSINELTGEVKWAPYMDGIDHVTEGRRIIKELVEKIRKTGTGGIITLDVPPTG